MNKGTLIVLFGTLLFFGCDNISNPHPLPDCLVGAATDLTAGPSGTVGDSTGYAPVSGCQTVTENVVLTSDFASNGGNCLVVGKDGIVIDGAGHTISGDGYAVWVQGYSDVTIRNLNAPDATIYLYGGDTNRCTIQNNTLAGVYVRKGDDHVIENNKLTFFSTLVDQGDTDHPTGLHFIGNYVEATSTDPVAFYGASAPPCPDTNFVISDNIFINHRTGLDDVPNVMRFGCSRKNVIRNNFMHGTDGAVGWYMRDDIDDSLFELNTLWTNEAEALRMAFGNVDKDPPSNNTFRNNIFRSEQGPGAWIEGISAGNKFEKNVFWGGMDLIYGPKGTEFDHNTFVSRRDKVVQFDLDLDGSDHFTNNIFYGSGTNVYTFDGFAQSRYEADYNAFWLESGTAQFSNFGTFAEWKQASADAGKNSDVHSIEQNPSFVDVGGGDFRLLKTSPLLTLGSDGKAMGAYPESCSP